MPVQSHYADQIVRVTDLTVTRDLIADIRFENCVVFGPAVFVMLESVAINNCTFDAPLDDWFWPMKPERRVIGAVGLQNCVFEGCRFTRIGFAGTDDVYEMFARDLL
ncbi:MULTISPECIES: hypothetical protein [unclassified Gordonia (in: high G+C Gram-positive bacteria)]|uniref:hypothetical protein n=1 Tax=unclassified Gordonia (in: high G+C Gram-positive bacteria) TaxID=2657482 RepID=UPI0019662A74|nr:MULTISPECIES: hypothetical protein [unclassified Gordonia (in: high G+C Gram-positive bacteria)]MBN0975438.1 hypothetical protein [Gordonia sp. BP-119]MBN0985585.1 hypothetical protein [Gordonia sp. BP-94]